MAEITKEQKFIAAVISERCQIRWTAQADAKGELIYRAVVDKHDWESLQTRKEGFFLRYLTPSEPEGRLGIRTLTMSHSRAMDCLQDGAKGAVMEEVRRRAVQKSPQGHDGLY